MAVVNYLGKQTKKLMVRPRVLAHDIVACDANSRIILDDNLDLYTTIHEILIYIPTALAGNLKIGLRYAGNFLSIGSQIVVGATTFADDLLGSVPVTGALALWTPVVVTDTTSPDYNTPAPFGSLLTGLDITYPPKLQLVGTFDTAQTATSKIRVKIDYVV